MDPLTASVFEKPKPTKIDRHESKRIVCVHYFLVEV